MLDQGAGVLLERGVRPYGLKELLAPDHAVPPRHEIEEDLEDLKPSWESDKVSFFASSGVFGENGMEREIARIIYYFDGVKNTVERKYAGERHGFDEENADVEILLDSVEDASFSYCHESAVEEGEYEWVDTWESENSVPRGVKMSITMDKKHEDRKEDFEKVVFIPVGELGTGE